MGLFESISSDNRVVDQGDSYEYNVEPAVTDTVVSIDRGQGTAKVFDKETVLQWHGVVRFAKRYRYVGLTETAANTAAASILAAYSVDADRWAVGISVETSGGVTRSMYKYLNVGSMPVTCARVTPTHVEGGMWSVEVDVDAEFEIYTPDDDEPSASDLTGLVTAAGIHNFPESS